MTGAPPPAPARPVGLRPAGVIARYVVLGAALGVAVGVLWVLLAPRVVATSLDPATFDEQYPQGFAVADLTLGSLLLVAGGAIGLTAAIRLRRTGFDRGWAQVVGAIASASMCAAVARVVGWWLAGRTVSGREGSFELPLTVGANGVLLLGAFSALLVVVLYAAFAREPTGAATMPGSGRSEPL